MHRRTHSGSFWLLIAAQHRQQLRVEGNTCSIQLLLKKKIDSNLKNWLQISKWQTKIVSSSCALSLPSPPPCPPPFSFQIRLWKENKIIYWRITPMPRLAPGHCLSKNYFLINNLHNVTVNQNIAILEQLRNTGSTVDCPEVLEAVTDIFMHYQKQVFLSPAW